MFVLVSGWMVCWESIELEMVIWTEGLDKRMLEWLHGIIGC